MVDVLLPYTVDILLLSWSMSRYMVDVIVDVLIHGGFTNTYWMYRYMVDVSIHGECIDTWWIY